MYVVSVEVKTILYTAKLWRGKLLRLCAKYTIHWKTFAVHQAVAIMYCTQQVIQGGKLLQSTEKPQKSQKFSPSKVLPYMVLP